MCGRVTPPAQNINTQRRNEMKTTHIIEATATPKQVSNISTILREDDEAKLSSSRGRDGFEIYITTHDVAIFSAIMSALK
jgi:hypothetical protein